jgi:hypothetical protein
MSTPTTLTTSPNNPLANNQRRKSVPRSISSESFPTNSLAVVGPPPPQPEQSAVSSVSSTTSVNINNIPQPESLQQLSLPPPPLSSSSRLPRLSSTSGHQTTLLKSDIRMLLPRYVVDAGKAIYQHEKTLFSSLNSHTFGVGLVWSDWTMRTIIIYEQGMLSYSHPVKEIPPLNHFYNIKNNIEVKLMGDIALDGGDGEGSESTERLQGMVIKCKSHDNIDCYIRCILSGQAVSEFINALVTVTGDENLKQVAIESLQRDALENEAKKNTPLGSTKATMKKTTASATHLIQRIGIVRKKSTLNDNASVMRKAVARAMDSYDRRTKEEKIRAKRGDFHWLPVLGDNDLIHGSW